MHRPRLVVVLSALSVLVAAPVSYAANENARIVLHLTSPTTKNQCLTGTLPSCSSINTQGLLYPAAYYAYVLVTNGDRVKGIAGVQFGIDYDGQTSAGVDVLGWTLCGTLNFPSPGWPGAGTGNLVTWDPINKCQLVEPGGLGTGVIANAGYFYVAAYSPDDLEITVRPVDGMAKVASCEASEAVIEGGGIHYVPSHLGYARFSSSGLDPGYNACMSGPPVNMSCSITGPSSVRAGTTGHVYNSTTNAPPGAIYYWTLGGAAQIVGPTNGSSVTVNAAGPGSFHLNCNITASGVSIDCSKDVTVTPGTTCNIMGLVDVIVNNTYTYSVSSSDSATFFWTLQGNGSIVSNPSGPSVQVTPGPLAGSFILTVQATSALGTGTCTLDVDVYAQATCSVSGPSTAVQGSTVHHGLTIVPSMQATYLWSITGNASLIGGPTTQNIAVLVGNPGSYTVACAFSGASGSGSCSKTVAVESRTGPGCLITGESTVLEGSINNQYQGSTVFSGASYAWSIAGEGTITTATNGSVVRVTAGAAGSFTLTLIVTASDDADTCERVVTVSATPPSGPGSNDNAKVMIHVLSPTTKNACTRSAAFPECNAVNTNGGLYPETHYSYVLLNDGHTNGGLLSGIGALEFGISYNPAPTVGVDIYSWTLCGNTESPVGGWPASGSGNRVYWQSSNCQRYEPGGLGTGVVTTAGFFYMAAYTPDVLAIVPPANSAVRVTDCQGFDSIIEGSGVNHFPSHLGAAGFGGQPGYNPCAIAMPVVRTTWSGIKTLYR